MSVHHSHTSQPDHAVTSTSLFGAFIAPWITWVVTHDFTVWSSVIGMTYGVMLISERLFIWRSQYINYLNKKNIIEK